MHPMPHEYHEVQIERFAAAFATFAAGTKTKTVVVPKLYVAAGEPIFSGHENNRDAYLITSGEIVLLRNGLPVDLLEEDELLDLTLWPGTVAMAHRSCTLIPMAMVRQ